MSIVQDLLLVLLLGILMVGGFFLLIVGIMEARRKGRDRAALYIIGGFIALALTYHMITSYHDNKPAEHAPRESGWERVNTNEFMNS